MKQVVLSGCLETAIAIPSTSTQPGADDKVSLIAVGAIWGCTNPFIKLGSQGIEQINTGSTVKNLCQEFKTIGMRLKYLIPFLFNQCGSVLYVWTLQSCNIMAAVPVANSLSFAFTAITGYTLGEKIPGKNVTLGTLLICFGSSLMLYDQVAREALKT